MYIEFTAAKNDFLAAAARTYASGIQTGTGGNLSVRIPGSELMLVKPSGLTFGQCSEDNLCITDFDGNLIEGKFKPTQESTLHGSLYKEYAQIGGIVHTHSIYSILCSLSFQEIVLPTMHASLKLKKNIGVADVQTQAVSHEEMYKVFELMDKEQPAGVLLLKGHGIVSCAKTAVSAGQNCELVEETARIFWELNKISKGD